MQLFEKGFVRGCDACANVIGEMYYYGHGVEQNIQKAIDYYKLALKNNNSTAYYNLGRHYYFGLGVKRDDSIDYNYFVEAEKRGCYYAAEFLSSDKTKLRSHIEMEAKYFGERIKSQVIDSRADNLTDVIVDRIL